MQNYESLKQEIIKSISDLPFSNQADIVNEIYDYIYHENRKRLIEAEMKLKEASEVINSFKYKNANVSVPVPSPNINED